MAHKHIFLFLGAAALGFFLRATFNQWPGFSSVYNIGYGGGGNTGSTSSTTGS